VSKRKHRGGDLRTWLLLVLALVPTWSVLAGAGWLWSERGEEIAEFDTATNSANVTYELFVITSQLLRAEASLEAAALPESTTEIYERAERDLRASLAALRDADRSLVPLLDHLDLNEDATADAQVLTLIGGSLSAAIDAFESQVVGDPVQPQLTFLVNLARDNASGLVLPLAVADDPETTFIYDALAATVQYHDQFDRDRAVILTNLADSNDASEYTVMGSTALRDALWQDVINTRSLLPVEVDWLGTSANPETPILLDANEPLSTAIQAIDAPAGTNGSAALFLALQQIDDALGADVDLAYSELQRETDAHLTSLLHDRWLLAMTSCIMAVLGLALAGLTISEVRRRRRVESAHDVAIAQLGEKADRDPTTGAWNRRRLESSLTKTMHDAPQRNEIVVLAYLDLDHFKAINDVWGHSTGDRVLRTVTERLYGFSYRGVEFELCRFGGDEFVLHASTTKKSLMWLEGLGSALIEAVDSDMDVNGRHHAVGASVGIATSTEDSTLDSLLLEADSSLILAKQERGTAVVYNRDISRTGELVHALPSALASGEVCVHIQPVVHAVTGDVLHVEALARWWRPSGESVSPSVFVPLVESYGLAEKLTSTVLGCVQHLIDDPSTPASVRVWVNVSPRELDVVNFADRTVALLRQLGIPPTRIGLEITETAAVRDPDRLAIELRRLRDVGISVAIDDFGNGYSPLGYLRLLPVDVVKLDRSLISNIDTDIANQHIVIGVVGFVHELGMSVVAEGVERVEEQRWLIDQGVERMQGFLFERPTDPADFGWHPRLIDASLHSNDGAANGISGTLLA